MEDLHFDQRWLVVDVDTDADLRPVGGRPPGVRPGPRRHVHADRATRYRWEFQLLPGETADQYAELSRDRTVDRAVDARHSHRRAAS